MYSQEYKLLGVTFFVLKNLHRKLIKYYKVLKFTDYLFYYRHLEHVKQTI